jgi:hypothetical protein
LRGPLARLFGLPFSAPPAAARGPIRLPRSLSHSRQAPARGRMFSCAAFAALKGRSSTLRKRGRLRPNDRATSFCSHSRGRLCHRFSGLRRRGRLRSTRTFGRRAGALQHTRKEQPLSLEMCVPKLLIRERLSPCFVGENSNVSRFCEGGFWLLAFGFWLLAKSRRPRAEGTRSLKISNWQLAIRQGRMRSAPHLTPG